MATKITSSNHGDSLQGSPEKRLDVAPDGTLWAAIVTQGGPGTLKFFRSSNGGSTWTYASGSDLSLRQSTAVPSFFIDADGYAHVSWLTWNADPQLIVYARGTPTGGGGWSWQQITISPASGRLGVDTDIVAFRNGTGWVAWISWNTLSAGGHTSRVNISQSGSLSVGATVSGPASGASLYQPGAMEFVHTGDGRTPAAAPSILYTTFIQGAAGPIRLNRALYSGGTWTWDAPVTAVASAQIDKTTLAQVFDGTRLMVAYATGGATISAFEWVPGGGAVTARNPPAAPGGTGAVLGLSMSVDQATGDIYLAYYDATDGDIRWSQFVRATLTWSAWAVAVSQAPPSGADGKVQLVRHPPRDSVDMLFAQGGGTAWTIYHQQLVALVRSPTAPTLVDPASGALADLASGYTFRWTYNPVSPGDTQQGWYFRRQASGGSIEYWNAATQAWGASAVLNTGSASQAIFPAAKWVTGTTYTWSARTRSSTGSDSPWAPDRTVVATSAPLLAVTGPTGIVYGESTPLVEWTYTSTDAQRSYEVAVFTVDQAAAGGFDPAASTAVWRSGVVNSAIARSTRVGTPLADGQGYRAYVRATSVASVNSAWAYSQFVISTAPPIGPIIELRDHVQYETKVPRVRFDVLAQSNFMSQDQANGQAGWVNDANGTLEVQPDDAANQLVRSLKMTSIGAGLVSALSEPGSAPVAPFGQPQPLGPLSWPVVPGQAYTALASFKAAGSVRAARVVIRWYDADDGTGALISESVGGQVVTGTTAYSPAFVTDTAPPTAKLARVAMQVLGPVAGGEIFYASAASFAPGRSTIWGQGGYAATQTVHIERSLDGGLTWEVAIDRLKTDLYQRASGFDRSMPYRTDVKYRASTVVDIGSSAIASAASLTSTIRINADVWAIRDPDNDLVEINAYVTAFEETDDESNSVNRPAGRFYPVIDTEGLRAATGYMNLYVKGSQLDAVKDILRRTTPFVIQSPSGRVLRARLVQRDYAISASRDRDMRLKWIEVQS